MYVLVEELVVDNDPEHKWIDKIRTARSSIDARQTLLSKVRSNLGPTVPEGCHMTDMNGLVEELVVDNEPEHKWIDKIRTARSSNDARQTLLSKVRSNLGPTVPEGCHMTDMYGLVEELVVDNDPEHKWIDKIRTARSSNDAQQTLLSKVGSNLGPTVPEGCHMTDMYGLVEELVVDNDPEHKWIDKIRTARSSNDARQTLLFKVGSNLGPTVPEGCHMMGMYGLVDELVVDNDPEHKWIDKIRTARSSNDARQTLLSKLAGQVIRKMGVKVLEMGGNSILGYRQSLDLEGVSGLVIRGIGTAVRLIRITPHPTESGSGPASIHSSGGHAAAPWTHLSTDSSEEKQSSPTLDPIIEIGAGAGSPVKLQDRNASPRRVSATSDSVTLSPTHLAGDPLDTPKAAPANHPPTAAAVDQSRLSEPPPALPGTGAVGGHVSAHASALGSRDPVTGHVIGHLNYRGGGHQQHSPLLPHHVHHGLGGVGGGGLLSPPILLQQHAANQTALGSFFTLTELPRGSIRSLGGVVAAKSVKLIDKGEQEGHLIERDEWWLELRHEISSHMKALKCDGVLGYRETTTIHKDVCVLSASGTAVLLDLSDRSAAGGRTRVPSGRAAGGPLQLPSPRKLTRGNPVTNASAGSTGTTAAGAVTGASMDQGQTPGQHKMSTPSFRQHLSVDVDLANGLSASETGHQDDDGAQNVSAHGTAAKGIRDDDSRIYGLVSF